ncbi:uncharacterized protein F5Z01DRAFT_130403 [Emericellopsis atlantica]|uniref:Uncharacterized protein n=1 Tax=Emericellopsis atlantica TaxID=2614577 RepID=A0A9P7ZKR6_9HYPO|nr:uncharacterized protein F5Z01DRAFT_130403 [Emericellopsis atlantica]KAG9253810.1 hypothetical protein F5Z01DRAFT_130403 [Emericellopsis atlantica]
MTDNRAQTLEANLTWPLRPVLTSLNGDNSWLFSFPRPEQDGHAKYFYHIAFEPWLTGPTTKISSWLVHISLKTEAAMAHGDAVQEAAGAIEQAAATVAKEHNGVVRVRSETQGDGYNGVVDAIFLFLDEVDHCHRPTLETFDKRIPFIGSKEVVAKVSAWQHFESITTLTELDASLETWQGDNVRPSPFPEWLTAFKLPGESFLNFVGVFVWTHTTASGEVIHESILDSPHGNESLYQDSSPINAFLASKPPTKQLALLHGLKESFTTRFWRTTHGAEAGLRMYRKTKSKYWIMSHEAELGYQGVVLRATTFDTARTLDWALEREGGKDVDFKDVGNGNSFVMV